MTGRIGTITTFVFNQREETELEKLFEEDRAMVEFGHGNCNGLVEDLERIVEDLKGEPASHIAQQYAHLKRLYDELDSTRKRLYATVERVKMGLLPEAFEKEGIKSFTTQDGYRVTISQRVFASCPSETKHEAYRWLKDHGFENIVQETVHAGTLSSLAKSIMKGDDPDAEVFELPENLFKVDIRPQTSVTKTK